MTVLSQLQEGVAHYDRANELRDLHQYDEALTCFEKAVQILASASEPLRICLFYDLAICYDFSGQTEKANEWFVKAIKLYKALRENHPNDPAVNNLHNLIAGSEEQLQLREHRHPLAEHYLDVVTARRFKGRDMPLKLFIDRSEDSGYDEDLSELIASCFDLWIKGVSQSCRELHIDKPICYELWETPVLANIKVHRTDGTNSRVPATSGGQTTYQHNSRFRQATIWAYLPKHKKADLTTKQERVFQSLLVHEAGHALGIDGHSPFGNDLMYWKSALAAPSARDLKTLALIYL
jgi:tetratricopeptide (TPR) repeat protein